MNDECPFVDGDGVGCRAGTAPALVGAWAQRGYCYTHAAGLADSLCLCAAGAFYSQQRSRLSDRRYVDCGYCRARAEHRA